MVTPAPAPVTFGWVEVAPGELRPAYRHPEAPDVTVYSPKGAGSWRDCPAQIAATWRGHYIAGAWQPFVVPQGMRIVS